VSAQRKERPTTPTTQPLTGITRSRFSLNPRSLATTNGITFCFLFLRVLRCFTSPRSLLHPMHSDAGDTTQLVPGYPIRTPWDHSSVDSSPRPIAASHVLHRLLVPRHPPIALTNLTTKMLASTIQFSTNNPTHPPPQHTPQTRQPPDLQQFVAARQARQSRRQQPHVGLFPQDPTGCSPPPPQTTRRRSTPTHRAGRTRQHEPSRPVTTPVSPPIRAPPRNPRPWQAP
jgi:hypothetical protein